MEPEADIEINGYHIHAFRVNHNITCYGYTVEIRRAGRFSVEHAKKREIPQKYWNRLQKGEEIETEDGAPAYSRPISQRISETESPMAGVGARERSMIPNGIERRLDASCATNCPTLVTLNAVFLMVSQSTSKFSPRTFSSAVFTTPVYGRSFPRCDRG